MRPDTQIKYVSTRVAEAAVLTLVISDRDPCYWPGGGSHHYVCTKYIHLYVSPTGNTNQRRQQDRRFPRQQCPCPHDLSVRASSYKNKNNHHKNHKTKWIFTKCNSIKSKTMSYFSPSCILSLNCVMDIIWKISTRCL